MNTLLAGHTICVKARHDLTAITLFYREFLCTGLKDLIAEIGRWSYQRSYCTSSPVSTEVSDRVEGIASWYNQQVRPAHPTTAVGWKLSTGQGAMAVPFGWEGNRRSDVALAMCHRLWNIRRWDERQREMSTSPTLHG